MTTDSIKTDAFLALGGIVQGTGRDGEVYLGAFHCTLVYGFTVRICSLAKSI